MNIRLLTISVVISINVLHAADNQLLRITMDETPEGYMRRLRTDERQINNSNDIRFVLKKPNDRSEQEVAKPYRYGNILADIKKLMKQFDMVDYFDYFMAVAESTGLTDEQKIQDQYLMVPPIKHLHQGPVKKQQYVFDALTNKIGNCNIYPIIRLLYAAVICSQLNLNKSYDFLQPLQNVVLRNDIAVVRKLLSCGADQNTKEVLERSQSLRMAQLLLDHGCDFQQQHQKRDLIEYLCSITGEACSANMLCLFLSKVQLEESNELGSKWFKKLIEQVNFGYWRFIEVDERVTALLKAGCYYEDAQIEQLINKLTAENEYDSKQQKLKKCQMAENIIDAVKTYGRKPIVNDLLQRRLTGKSSRSLVSNARDMQRKYSNK